MSTNMAVFSALNFAAIAHYDQVRKVTNLPYITHPIKVMGIISDVCKGHPFLNDLLVCAALHDTIEDCNVTFNDLTSQFGITVASIVHELTNVKGYNGLAKQDYLLNKIDNVMSDLAVIVKLADRLDNISDEPSEKVMKSTMYILDNSTKLKQTSDPYIKMLTIALVERLNQKMEKMNG